MKKILIFTLIVFSALVTFAQEKTIKGNMNAPLPVDPNVRIGTLENGLTYYIRKNEKPEDKVELRLVVNAGSMLEEEEQQGLAHFLEHMAFNGTKNFEKNELVSYLQSVGVKFGADLNAYTSFDETVYILPIPSDDEEILDKGLLVLEDWAHNINLTEEEIDKERGVVIEEWRLGQGASQRMRDEWFPIMFKDSRYAERLPIGKKEVLENFDYEAIRQFYKDWYRPDLMAVIAVGDIDPDAMEKKIKERFGRIEETKEPKERKYFEVPDHEDTFIKVVTDPEASFTQIQLVYKQDNVETEDLFDYRRDIVYSLYSGMLNKRLDELKQSAQPPFFFASSGFGSMVRTKSNYTAFAVVGEDGVENGLKALVAENERVKRFGFTEGELNRYKAELLNRIESSYKESDKTESGRYAGEYIRNFLSNEPIPGITFEYEFHKRVLPQITLEEVNKLAEGWIKESNRVVVVTGAEKEGVIMPTEDQIQNILEEASGAELTPYEEEELSSSFIEELPTPGKIVSSKNLEVVDADEMTLSNGVRVILKSTDFKNDEILMRAYSLGGQSIYPDSDHENASFASDIINESGVKDFSTTDIQKMLSGKTVSVYPYISNLTEGFRGNAAPKDLESMLQLLYLYFTAPRKDPGAFDSFKAKNNMLFGNLMSNPQFFYSDQVSKILTQNHPRAGGFPRPEDLEKIDYDRSFEIYSERFMNAGDFTFFFVGNFKKEEIKPLLEQYLGSLPAIDREETWRDLGIRPPNGKVEEVVYKGTDQKSQVTIVYRGETTFDIEEEYKLSSLAELLTNKLIDLLREEKGGVYGVGASGGMSQYPYENYSFRIAFPCSPDNVEELKKSTFDLIEQIKKEGVAEEDLQKVKESQKRERKENLKKNNYWLSTLFSYYYSDRNLKNFYDYDDRIDALTANDLKDVANKYLGSEYIEVVLMPEDKK